jgi:hypothetical protein
LLASLILLNGCAIIGKAASREQCKIQTYNDAVPIEYISNRKRLTNPIRLAVFPFSVPENFAHPGPDSSHFGRKLAQAFQSSLLSTGEIPIVELYGIDRWPGKKEEFFAGNFQAISLARNAGYDLVLVGYLEELKNDKDLVVYTKLIDTFNSVTIWSAQTTATSNRRALQKGLFDIGFDKLNADDFAITARVEKLVDCTTKRLFSYSPHEEEKTEEKKSLY